MIIQVTGLIHHIGVEVALSPSWPALRDLLMQDYEYVLCHHSDLGP